MRIISHRTLVLFYTKHADAKSAIEEWFHKTEKANWESFADIKKTFNSVDAVGNQRFVFNIKGNDYRLVNIIEGLLPAADPAAEATAEAAAPATAG